MIAAGGGSIINIASILGLVSSWLTPNSSYTASKGAVVNLTRELGCEWARQRVRVNARSNGGWKVMQTALAYERVLMGGAAPQMFPKAKAPAPSDHRGEVRRSGLADALGVPEVDLMALARARGVSEDPVVRQHLVELHILETLSRWNGARARAEMKRGYSSPAASIGKLAMSHQLHFAGRVFADILGAEAMLARSDSDLAGDCALTVMNAYVNSSGGGTDQIQRNILGERVLALPKEPEVDRAVAFRDVLKSPTSSR